MPRSNLRLVQAILVLFIICGFIGGLVGAVNAVTKDRIFDLELERKNTAMRTVMPSGDLFTELTDLSAYGFDGTVSAFYEAIAPGGKLAGYCIEARPSGFASTMTVMVGVSAEGVVQGVVITDASGETPGLGTRVTEPAYTEQFVGKDSSLTFVKGSATASGEVSSISGATYSSRGVCEGVLSCIRAANTYTNAQKQNAQDASMTEVNE